MSGRKAAKDIRPGNMALSVGNPKLDIPNGWIWADLGEIATMATGHTPSRNYPEYWGGDIPWISVKDARPFHSKTIFSTNENTNDLGISKSAAVVNESAKKASLGNWHAETKSARAALTTAGAPQA